MALNSPVTIDWLRKGRRVEDMKILRKLIVDSSEWKVDNGQLSRKLFEKKVGITVVPGTPLDSTTINRILGQDSVTEIVRINKNNITPKGSKLREQVESLLPSNLVESETNSLSYILSRIVNDEILFSFKWPVVPEGLDSLSAALYTINIITQVTGNSVRWLLPIWSLKADEFKLEILRSLIENEIKLETLSHSKMRRRLSSLLRRFETAKDEIEEFLKKEEYSGQDPLSDKIDLWIVPIGNLKGKLKELKAAGIKLTQSRKSADFDKTVINEIETEISSLENVIAILAKTIEKNKKMLKSEIHSLRTRDQQFTEWANYCLNPAGPLAFDYEHLLKKIRNEVNILTYKPLIKICEFLRDVEQPGLPSATDIKRVLGLKQRMANYTLVRLGLILNERYIFSPSTLGLRYRFILTEKQKPGVLSDALIERQTMSLSDKYSGCTVHIEPVRSVGPSDDILPDGAIQIIADSEHLSMRLDLFDEKEERWDLSSAFETDLLSKPISRSRNSKWLFQSSDNSSSVNHLSPTEIDNLGVLSVSTGLRSSRKWFFEQLQFNPTTSRRYVRRMLDQNIFRLMYLPSLEYCGLPIGLVVGGRFNTEKNRNLLKKWMTLNLPFVRIFTGDSTNLIAYLRLPADATSSIKGFLRETFEPKAENLFVSGVMSNQTYHLTTFHRLANVTGDGWKDPWA
ncbi:MAG: hypothetical protein RTV41_00950 [Candidatus Thorarchaeota archaeon]